MIDRDWRRLSVRLLLLGPLRALSQLAIPAVGVVVFATRTEPGTFITPVLAAVMGIVVIGLLPWLTTGYRIADGRLERRSGLFNKKVAAVRLDRVRSVDVRASFLQRLVGVSTLTVGSGADDLSIALDALTTAEAARLREQLLASRGALPTEGQPVDLPAPTSQQVLATIDWSWLRFAPLNPTGFAVSVAIVGIIGQFGNEFGLWEGEPVRSFWLWIVEAPWLWTSLAAVVLVPSAWIVLCALEFATKWWRMELIRESGNLRLTHGLLSTRSVSVEEARVRGVKLTESLVVRWFGGGDLATLSTGVSGGETGILPTAPRAVLLRVGGDVLGAAEQLATDLVRHGSAARRRCHVRAQRLTLGAVAVLLVARVWVDVPAWAVFGVAVAFVVGGVGVAEASYRHLGHLLTAEHLVVGSGATARIRHVLETDGIIGWTFAASWFQRRAGLVTLVATTAAGSEHVTITDIPRHDAVALANRATPGLLSRYLADAR